MASSAREWRELERQVALLEHGGGGDGCPRCRGIRIVIRSSENNALHTATSTYSGKTEDLSENELAERETETTCPRCGRNIESDEGTVIKIGDSIAPDG